MNFGATAEITKFDLPPIPRFLCAYVGDEWVIVARDTEACKKHFDSAETESYRSRLLSRLSRLCGD